MQQRKTALSRLLGALLALVLLASLAPTALAAQTVTITTQAEWDALFDAGGAQQPEVAASELVVNSSESISNQYPLTCAKLSLLHNGSLTSSADITANVEIDNSGTLRMEGGAAIHGNVTQRDGRLSGAVIYGDYMFEGGTSSSSVYEGTLYNNAPGQAYNFTVRLRNSNTVHSINPGQHATFSICAAPALAWAGGGAVSWPAVPGALQYTVNLHKDSPQSAAIATVTTANLSHDFTADIQTAGPGTYYLSAQTDAQAPKEDGGNYTVYRDGSLAADYPALTYGAAQDKWDELFDGGAQKPESADDTLVIGSSGPGAPVVNQHPLTCANLSLNGSGSLISSADITANVEIDTSGMLTMTGGAAIHGNVTLKNGALNGAAIYGDFTFYGGSTTDTQVYEGTLYNVSALPYYEVVLPSGSFSLYYGQHATFAVCAAPALAWADAAAGSGLVRWPAVPGALQYTVNLHKDSPQSAAIATIVTGEPSCDFTAALQAAGPGVYYLSAQSFAQPPDHYDDAGNWKAYHDGSLAADYAALTYPPAATATPAPGTTATPTPGPGAVPTPTPKPNPNTGVRPAPGGAWALPGCAALLVAGAVLRRRAHKKG